MFQNKHNFIDVRIILKSDLHDRTMSDSKYFSFPFRGEIDTSNHVCRDEADR